MIRNGIVYALAATACAAAPAVAQDLLPAYAPARYGAFGLGTGSVKLTCDGGCLGRGLSTTSAMLMVGRLIGGRVRIELGGQMQVASGDDFNDAKVSVGQLGLATYIVPRVYVRAAGTYVHADVRDSLGETIGGSGPGFNVGAGLEAFVGGPIAITLYANYHSASMANMDRTAGSTTVRTDGTLSGTTFGLSIGRSNKHGPFMCVRADGSRIRLGNNRRFRACLEEYRRARGLPLR